MNFFNLSLGRGGFLKKKQEGISENEIREIHRMVSARRHWKVEVGTAPKGQPKFQESFTNPTLYLHVEDYKKYMKLTNPVFSPIQFHIERIKGIEL